MYEMKTILYSAFYMYSIFLSWRFTTEIEPILSLFQYEKKSFKRSSINFMIKNVGALLSPYEREKIVEDSCRYKIYTIKKNILNILDLSSGTTLFEKCIRLLYLPEEQTDQYFIEEENKGDHYPLFLF